MNQDCLFCQIVAGDIPTSKRYEDDLVIAFDDIHPKAPVHILIIPKQHLNSLADAQDSDLAMLGHLMLVTAKIARDNGLSGYKTQINTGREGGQVINHLHLHLLGSDPARQGVGFQGLTPEVEV